MTPYEIAQTLLICLFRASIATIAVIPLAWLTCRLLQRTPRSIHCWVWRFAYLKILVLSVGITPIPIPILPSTVPRQDAGSNPIPPTPLIEDASVVAVVAPVNPETSMLPPLVAALWLAGVAASCVRLSWEWRFASRIVQSASPSVNERLLQLYTQAAEQIAVRRPPPLLESATLPVPALVGLFRATVVLPQGIANELRPEEIVQVLRHELCHLKRGDAFWNMLARLVETMLFFHPLIWWARRRWLIAQEIACDELATQTPHANLRAYATMLLKLAKSPRTHVSHAVAVNYAASFQSLYERITAMQSPNNWGRKRYAAAISAATLVCLIGLVPWQLTAREQDDAAAKSTSTDRITDKVRVSDQKQLQGTWRIQAFHNDGTEAPKRSLKDAIIVIDEDTLSFKNRGTTTMTLKYQAKAGKRSGTGVFDTTHELDPGKPIAQLGIYSIKGKQLKIRIAAASEPRPTDFKPAKGSFFQLVRHEKSEAKK